MSAKYRRIHREEGNRPIQSMCRWVKVSKSGYYAWRNRPESSTTQRGEDLTAIIVKFFDESEQTHGYRRIHAEPARSGVKVSLDMVRDHGSSRSLAVMKQNRFWFRGVGGVRSRSRRSVR